MITEINENKKILIVDDNPRNVEVVANLLSGNNYDIEFAVSGEEALEWVEKAAFDLILMDIMMPGIDGYEACRQIREKEACRDVPVIFLTAKTDTESLSKAFRAGGVDYVSKPFRSEELLARVATHLELKQRREELKELNARLEEKVRERTRELQESNTKLSIALKDLKQLDNTKTDFLHMVSHELRTPLNGILGGMDLLKAHSFSDGVMDYLSILDLSTRRLESFSYKALDITQLQTMGASILHLNRISLSAFVETFIREYEKANNVRPGRLVLHLDATGSVVEADNNYFRKVLEIIVENALQYSPENKPVQVIVEEKNDALVCTIKDQGRGFTGSMLESSMMAFSPGVEHQDQRTGLSLHLARMVMHYLNGELQLSNAPEGGAVVSLVLPKTAPEEEKEDK